MSNNHRYPISGGNGVRNVVDTGGGPGGGPQAPQARLRRPPRQTAPSPPSQPPPPIITTSTNGTGGTRTTLHLLDPPTDPERRRSIVDPDGNFEKFLIGHSFVFGP